MEMNLNACPAAALLTFLVATSDASAERVAPTGMLVSVERPSSSFKECPIVVDISIPALRAGVEAPCFRGEEPGVSFYLDWASCICVRTGARPPFPMLGLYLLPDSERPLTLAEFAEETEGLKTLVGPKIVTVAGMQAIEVATVALGATTHWEAPGWRLVSHRFVFEVEGRRHECALSANEDVYRPFLSTFVSFCGSIRKGGLDVAH